MGGWSLLKVTDTGHLFIKETGSGFPDVESEVPSFPSLSSVYRIRTGRDTTVVVNVVVSQTSQRLRGVSTRTRWSCPGTPSETFTHSCLKGQSAGAVKE